MALYLGILLFSFILTSVLIIPFIDLLYRLQLIHHSPLPPSPKYETQAIRKLLSEHKAKIGTPIGGGILIIAIVTFLYAIMFPGLSKLGIYVTSLYDLKEELNLIFFTFISFGLLGLYDDLLKIFNLPQQGVFGFNISRKILIQLSLSFVIALMLHQNLNIDIIHLPFYGVLHIGLWFVPWATLVIAFFSRAFDITDGLDGLASGTLLICLLAFWAISVAVLDTALSMFLALWIGSLIAFLYFNVYPARIWLGNAGSLAFGATLAVTAILLGKVLALLVIGAIFLLDAGAHFTQQVAIRVFNRRLFPVTPVHYWLQSIGWPEPKVVLRAWILAVMCAVVGLWLSGL